jgi:hypothetical protein
METMRLSCLKSFLTPGAKISADGESYMLEIPAAPEGKPRYAVAQLDDYHARARRAFCWQAPFTLELRARLNAAELPGTWGFGLWNDPFSLSLGLGGAGQRFPCLPNAAWFFYASPPNYLSFRDDRPAQGFLAATFQSPQIPAPLLALASPLLALGWLPPAGRVLRRLLKQIVLQDSAAIQGVDVTHWHTYRVEWQSGRAVFRVDENLTFETPVSPRGPLGLVIWVDNQYAAFTPAGQIRFGILHHPLARLEIAQLRVVSGNSAPGLLAAER